MKRSAPKRVAELCDLIADGFTFKDVAAILDMPRAECVARFEEIRASYGRQGQ